MKANKLKESFEDKWKRVEERAVQRLKNDKSLEISEKKHQQLVKRLRKIEDQMATRHNQIFVEEIKKEFWQEQKV